MKWNFFEQPSNQVETEVTQWDQFSNELVDMDAALVRETVQNSLDAASGPEPVHVSFRIVDSDTGMNPKLMRKLFGKHRAHAAACGLNQERIDYARPKALVIEDYNTTGLTGPTTEFDESNFSDFWRRHGTSHKGGKHGGRWGLGKLVYSGSSRVGAFFGATLRESDGKKLFMGQTVMRNHVFQNKRYPAHTFFSDMLGKGRSAIQVPLEDEELVQELCDHFDFDRSSRPGLSIAIPFPYEQLVPGEMVRIAIENYFYPIITKQLTLNFDGTRIDHTNLKELGIEVLPGTSEDNRMLLEFIEDIYSSDLPGMLVLKDSWIDNDLLDETDFDQAELDQARAAYQRDEIVAITLPVKLQRRDGTICDTEFFVYVKRAEGITKGSDLYVRGCLTVPGEAKFGERKALGAMVAADDGIASFLADAENPAHTKWNISTTKLKRNYVNPARWMRAIKRSVKDLYDILAQVTDEEDTESLKKFFYTDVEKRPAPTPDSGTSAEPPPEIPLAKPAILSVSRTKGGFSIRPTKHATDADFPVKCVVRAAYDVPAGNPFKHYQPWDFDFFGLGGPKPNIQMTEESVNLDQTSIKRNELVFEIKSPLFQVNVSGFDTNRDLAVKLETLEEAK